MNMVAFVLRAKMVTKTGVSLVTYLDIDPDTNEVCLVDSIQRATRLTHEQANRWFNDLMKEPRRKDGEQIPTLCAVKMTLLEFTDSRELEIQPVEYLVSSGKLMRWDARVTRNLKSLSWPKENADAILG